MRLGLPPHAYPVKEVDDEWDSCQHGFWRDELLGQNLGESILDYHDSTSSCRITAFGQ